MPYDQIPISRVIITWARTRAGFSLQEAQNFFPKIEEWENGEAFPTYPQLEQLSEKFKLPIAVFFFPEPPATPAIRDSFRTLPEEVFESIPRRIKQLLRKGKALQLNLYEINDGANPARNLITRDMQFRVDAPIASIASDIRQYLGVPMERQFSWGSNDEALEKWREALNDVGVFVFKDAFREAGYSGFCLFDEVFPIIYVNNSTAKSRQIFTLFHELAHLIFHTSGVDKNVDDYVAKLQNDARAVEILCNRFAASFLVPVEEFDRAFAGRRITEETAENLADQFHVSRELIFRIFLDRGLISQQTYSEAAERWAGQLNGGTGGDFYNTQFAYLGHRYINLVLRQFHQNRISEGQLAEYLNIAPKNLSKFEERFAGRRA